MASATPLFDAPARPARQPAVFPTSSGHIKGLLKKRYCAPEWAIFFEVASATGAVSSRYADAIAMNLWPSRGLALNGFEIKISRSDWQTELKKPAKAEAMARNCDFWWIVAAKGVVREGELPPTWGLIEADARGLTAKVQAPKLDTPQLTRAFMASLVRRAGEFDASEKRRVVMEMTEEVRSGAAQRIKDEVDQRTREFRDLRQAVDDFERESGLSISGWQGGKSIGKAVALVKTMGVNNAYSGAGQLVRSARQLADSLERVLIDSGVPAAEGVLFDD